LRRTTVAVVAATALLCGLAPTAEATAPDPPDEVLAVPEPPFVSPPGSSPTVPEDHPAGPAVGHDALAQALSAGDISAARYALERVRTLVRPGVVERRYGAVAVPDPREATLLMRELAEHDDDLAPAARREAHRLLARPTQGRSGPDGPFGWPRDAATDQDCSSRICVHWVRGHRHSPPAADADADGVPNQVETTLSEFDRVWRVEVGQYGYRRPLSDQQHRFNGGDGKFDVYLSDTGSEGLYGYCNPDDFGPQRRVSAYCVVDDDFSRTQFGARPLDSLRVTAAHEFFHAIQFAYDWLEDIWLMEGTAAWVEDEVYDAINDNHQYLYGGPLTRPQRELDRATYEPWIFFRFMAERFGTARTDRPLVVRQIWERAGRSGVYSLEAVQRVSAAHGTSFRSLFADFGWTQPFARAVYDEGRRYPAAPMSRSFTLTAASPDTGDRAATLHHLSNRHVALRPGRSLTGARRLRVSLDLPDRVRGSEATVSVVRRDGRVRAYGVRLNRRGDGSKTVGFSRARVTAVVLTLTNASTRMRCHRRTMLSCAGQPRDDRLRFRYSARAVR
jgi:hypothetical protein